MAAPAATQIATASSKSTIASGITLAPAGQSLAVGDVLCVGFACDPNTGTISIVSVTGTSTLSAWTKEIDAINGSGTSGTRIVVFWAICTGAGTITAVGVTESVNGPRGGELFKITGNDGVTPIYASGNYIPGGSPANVSVPGGSRDVIAINFMAAESAGGAACTAAAVPGGTSTGWSSGSEQHDATSIGTTGGAAASNQSIAYASATGSNVGAGTMTMEASGPTGTKDCGLIIFQAPASATPVIPDVIMAPM